ncbi:MAG: hypothetical protein AAGB06_01720 [Verrucomicrobiota bacterium]
MSEFSIQDLLQTPQPPVKVTPLQFVRVFEVEWLRELSRVDNFKEKKFATQRMANFRENTATLQIWETIETEDEIHTDLVSTVESQLIPQKNELYAIQYAIWHLPTDRCRRFLSILGELENLQNEAARAAVILNGLLDDDYRPSLDISELADASVKGKRGRSISKEMREEPGGAMSTHLAEEMMGLKKD